MSQLIIVILLPGLSPLLQCQLRKAEITIYTRWSSQGRSISEAGLYETRNRSITPTSSISAVKIAVVIWFEYLLSPLQILYILSTDEIQSIKSLGELDLLDNSHHLHNIFFQELYSFFRSFHILYFLFLRFFLSNSITISFQSDIKIIS